jgi:hypothetical protein
MGTNGNGVAAVAARVGSARVARSGAGVDAAQAARKTQGNVMRAIRCGNMRRSIDRIMRHPAFLGAPAILGDAELCKITVFSDPSRRGKLLLHFPRTVHPWT